MDEANFLKSACPQCSGHVEFPAAAAGQTIACPHCQSPWTLPAESTLPSSKKNSRRTLTLVAGIVMAMLVVGSGGAWVFQKLHNGAATESPVPRTPAPVAEKLAAPAEKAPKGPGDLEAGPIKLEPKTGSSLVYAVGSLKNNSDHQRFGVKIEIDLFNAQGDKIGRSSDYISVIEPRASWAFRGLVNEAKATSARAAQVIEQD